MREIYISSFSSYTFSALSCGLVFGLRKPEREERSSTSAGKGMSAAFRDGWWELLRREVCLGLREERENVERSSRSSLLLL